MIYTIMFAFDQQGDWNFLEHIKGIFDLCETEFYYVELVAPREVRLQRNVTENRLKNKPSKRNIETSNERLIADDENYRLESYEGEFPFDNYMKIDNTELSPATVAKMIKEKFNL